MPRSLKTSGESLFTFLANELQAPDISPLLADVIAVGSPALRCWPPNIGPGYGLNAWGREVVLPLSLPPDVVEGETWIRGALAAVRIQGRPLHPESQRLLAASLAPGEPRRDGLPAFTPCGPDTGGAEAAAVIGTLQRPYGTADEDYSKEAGRVVYRQIVDYRVEAIALPPLLDGSPREARVRHTRWQRHDRLEERGTGRNRTAAVRDVLAAVSHDLVGLSAQEVGETILGAVPRQHGEHNLSASTAWRTGEGSPYAAWKRGRSVLAQLGCWPWAHAVDGRLPRLWRSEDTFLEPLEVFVLAHS